MQASPTSVLVLITLMLWPAAHGTSHSRRSPAQRDSNSGQPVSRLRATIDSSQRVGLRAEHAAVAPPPANSTPIDYVNTREHSTSRQYHSNKTIGPSQQDGRQRHESGRKVGYLTATNTTDYAPAGTRPAQASSRAQLTPLRFVQNGGHSSESLARFARQTSSGIDSRVARCDETARPAIHGIRCDQGGAVDEGILVIKANEPTALMLIGEHLDANVSIALTPEEHAAQADCTHADRVKSLAFKNISANIAQVQVDVPASIGPRKPYFLCLRDGQGRWHHQGPSAWLKLYVEEDLLPVYMKIVVVACLLVLSGLFSGLNLGLMALDKNELQVIISCGSDTEKRYARAIEPVRRRGNYLLCSILFSNVLVNSTIAVLLEELTSGIVAVMTSTIFIVMFGEILPQAFCSRHGLAVGAKTVSITYFCMIVTFPLSYPVSSCLDWALGEEIGHAYDRERLMEFIRVTRDYNNLETDEVNIISGALKLKRIPLSEVMTRIEDVYMLDLNSCLDFDTIQAIITRGYSRIPVHEPGNKKNIVALLFAKDLALLDPDDKTPVQTLISFYNHPIMFLFEDTTLDLALNEFKTGKSHMAFVRRVIDDGDRDPIYEITGIVTLEDVIEEIMQMEINDETDTLSDNKRKKRRNEAQVRRDFSQFTTTNFGAGESSLNVVTPQLCLAAYQYLATTVEAFSSKFISDTVLKRLLSQRIYYKVRVDQDDQSRSAAGAGATGKKAERRLYTAGEPADYFVMILEGRVNVVCGKERLVFDGGPFSYFGSAALSPAANQADKLLDSPMISSSSAAQLAIDSRPQGSGATERGHRESVIELKKLIGPSSYKRLSAENNDELSLTTIIAGATGSTSLVNFSARNQQQQQQPAPLPMPNQQGQPTRLKSSSSRSSITSTDKASSFMIPDYTVDIACDTSYLKITRHEYLAALKATILERATGPVTIPDDDEDETVDELDSSPLKPAGS